MEEKLNDFVEIEVPLKKIMGNFRNPNFYENFTRPRLTSKGVISYDFEALKKDLLDPNIKLEEYKSKDIINEEDQLKYRNSYFPITVYKFKMDKQGPSIWNTKYTKYHDQFEYSIKDGNHRCYVYLQMYGEDYKVKVRSYELKGTELKRITK
mgnify:CR=1 FL=1|tara:strand:- start:1458 stop:1913 length:456 start_codon:yes stop_codon:yes gene_type:complete